MRKNTNYNKVDLGYKMPQKFTVGFMIGLLCIVISIYYGFGTKMTEGGGLDYLKFWVDISSKFWSYLGLVCTISAAILSTIAGKIFYKRNSQIASHINLFLAVILGVSACICHWMSMPLIVQDDGALYNIMLNAAVADILVGIGICLLFWSARVYLWSDFRETIRNYNELAEYKIVLDKYKRLASRVYSREAYFQLSQIKKQ